MCESAVPLSQEVIPECTFETITDAFQGAVNIAGIGRPVEAVNGLARTYFAAGRYGEASAVLQRLQRSQPSLTPRPAFRKRLSGRRPHHSRGGHGALEAQVCARIRPFKSRPMLLTPPVPSRHLASLYAIHRQSSLYNERGLRP